MLRVPFSAPSISAPSICPLLAVFLLAGCTVGPQYAVPDTQSLVPGGYATHDAALDNAAAEDRWWDALGDPVLQQLTEQALASNPDLASAQARVQQARALAKVAGAAFYPSVDLDSRVGRDQLSRNGENLALIPFTPPKTAFNDYRVGVDASWEIDLAGKTRRDVEAAVARLGSRAESSHDARAVVAAEVADAYVDYRDSTQRLALADTSVADLAQTAQLIALQQRAGLASMVDEEHAEANRSQASATLAPLLSAQASALFELMSLTGVAVETLRAQLVPARALPELPRTVPVGLPAALLRRRPDVRQAERELAAATADVGSTIAAQFPQLSLVGDLGWDSVRSQDLVSAASRYWSLGPQLTLPLLAGGRLRAQTAAARAAREAALGSYRSSVLRALADAESAIVRFATERQRQQALAAAATSLTQSAMLLRARYEQGDVSMIDVLVAEQEAIQARDQQLASQALLVRDYVALGKALGGGWQEPGVPAPPSHRAATNP